MRAEQYIDSLAASGRHHFTTSDAIEAIGGNDDAARAKTAAQEARTHRASPMRSFHVVVPPELARSCAN